MLGKTASTIMPAVIGTFQEYASRRAAREIDESVIREAEKHTIKANQHVDDETKAIQALGLGSRRDLLAPGAEKVK